MALNPLVSVRSTTRKFTKVAVGNRVHCYGKITFTASDVYATGGFDIRSQIKAVYGVGDVEAIDFESCGTDAGISSSSSIARYDYSTGKVSIYKVGIIAGAPTQVGVVSETEVGNGGSIDSCVFLFMATCKAA